MDMNKGLVQIIREDYLSLDIISSSKGLMIQKEYRYLNADDVIPSHKLLLLESKMGVALDF